MRLKVSEIKREMKRQGMGVADLAKKMGIKRQHMYWWLKHPERITLKSVTKIAKALGVNPLNILTQR